MFKSKINVIVLAILVLLGINYASRYLFLRFDLTENNEFTLSKASKDILTNLDDAVEVTAYFSDDLPVDITKVREELENLLNEFSSIAKGKFSYKFIAPNKDAQKEEEATKEGIRPVMINVREKINPSNKKHF
ncbi:MAG: GldG family protein [Saprospiraceae bacterium]|nr:GldG family protein [Saprospiraceae bacterium]